MRWKYDKGVMIWETPIDKYMVYPLNIKGRLRYILEFSDNFYVFLYREEAKEYARVFYSLAVNNIKLRNEES